MGNMSDRFGMGQTLVTRARSRLVGSFVRSAWGHDSAIDRLPVSDRHGPTRFCRMMFFTGTGAKEAVQISGVVEIEPDHLVIHAERSFIVVDDKPGPQNGWLYLYGLGEDHERARP